MQLSQLEAIIAIAEEGGFNKAAGKLHLAQSAISRKIAGLEEELQDKLFFRNGKRVCLTSTGETVLRYARRVSQDLRDMSTEITDIRQLKKGRLRIGAGMTACLYVLPPVLEEFRLLYPKIDMEVITETTDNVISLLRNHVLDLGIITLAGQPLDLSLIPLPAEEMVVAVSTKHPKLAKRKSLRAIELADEPIILHRAGASTRKVLDAFFAECGIEPRICMEAVDVALIKPLVRINLGIALLPLRAVIEDARRKELDYLRIQDHKLFRKQALAFQKTDHPPKVLVELIHLFHNTAA